MTVPSPMVPGSITELSWVPPSLGVATSGALESVPPRSPPVPAFPLPPMPVPPLPPDPEDPQVAAPAPPPDPDVDGPDVDADGLDVVVGAGAFGDWSIGPHPIHAATAPARHSRWRIRCCICCTSRTKTKRSGTSGSTRSPSVDLRRFVVSVVFDDRGRSGSGVSITYSASPRLA